LRTLLGFEKKKKNKTLDVKKSFLENFFLHGMWSEKISLQLSEIFLK
jgi:hypothetical protein